MIVSENSASLTVQTGVNAVFTVNDIGELGGSRIVAGTADPEISAYVLVLSLFNYVFSTGI